MSTEFWRNVFDEHAWRTGGWAYDNGRRYAGEFFGAAYVGERLGATEAESLLMLREGDTPGRTLILHQRPGQMTEIWSGQVETHQDFDQMMQQVGAYLEEYRKSSSSNEG